MLAITLQSKFSLQHSPIILVACSRVSTDSAEVGILFTEGDLETLETNAVDPIMAKEVIRRCFCDGDTSSNPVTGDN